MTTLHFRLIRALSGVAVAAMFVSACGGKSDADLTASGQKLLEAKDYTGAIIQFKSALQAKPDSGQLRLLLGKALLENGEAVTALVELQKAQELQVPDNDVVPAIAQAMLMAGEDTKLLAQYGNAQLTDKKASADLLSSLAAAHMVRGDEARATALVQQALQDSPGHLQATVLKARMLAAANNLDGSLALLDQALIAHPGDARAGLLRAEVLWHGKKDAAGALDGLRKVLAGNPKQVSAHTSIIAILNEQGKKPEAKAQLAELKKAAPNHPETLFFDAQMLFGDGEYRAARDIIDKLLKYMPENPRVLELAGASEYRLKQFPQAEAFLSKALKNAPGLALSRHLLAQTYLRNNQPSKAIELLQPVIQGKTPDGTSLALAGEAWMQMGETKKAEAAFAQAEKVAPNDARVRTSAALAQLAQGNSSAAIGQLESIAADDKGARADVALISARLRQNDLAGALKAIDGLERKTPDRPVADNLRGRVLLLKKDTVGATKSFEAALRKDANYFPAIASLAAIDFAAGKVDAARQRFVELSKSAPKGHESWLALAELGARAGDPPDQVVGYLRGAVKANGGAAAAHIALVNHLIGSGDGKSALTAAREASAALPNNLEVMELLGRAQLSSESAEQAVATFNQLTSLQGSNPAYHLRLAEALVANKDNAGARAALRKALEVKPDYAPAKRALVSLSVLDKRPQDGLVLAKDMQKQDAKDATGYALEGEVHLSQRDFDAASAAFGKALQLNKVTENFVRLHSTLRAGGKTAEAERLQAEWLKDRPKDAALRYYLGDLALAGGNLAGAEAQYRAVLEVQPRNALAMNNVAWLMVKQKKPGAVDLAQKANELMPGKSPLMDTLATALAAENKLPKAIEVQKAAIARSPSDPGLKLNLARLLIQSGDKAYARAELEDIAKLGDKFRGQAEVAELLKKL
jgi:putative PEP-CTERM system TPR-repeat lipoprotein